MVSRRPRSRRARLFTAVVFAPLVVVAMSLANTPSVHAQNAGEEKAKRLFTQGNDAFRDGRYADALGSYRKSFELVPRPRTMFNIANCEDRLGDLEAAYVAFQRFLSIAEARDKEQVEKAEARLAFIEPKLRIGVKVTSTPTGAAIYLGDETTPAGRTPTTLKLALGTHRLRLAADGFEDAHDRISVRPGEELKVHQDLHALARLTITTEPSDATIEPRGDAGASTTGRYTAVVEPGTYHFKVTREGYHGQDVSIQVTANEPATKHIMLRELGSDAPQTIIVQTRGQSDKPKRGAGLRYAGLATLAAGGLAIAGGIKFGLDAKSKSDEAHDIADTTGVWNGDAIGALDSADTAQTRMFVAYGVGAAAIIGGSVLYYLGSKAGEAKVLDEEGDADALTWSTGLSPSGLVITLSGRFW